eukprot:TRINITY_DN1322_c0_g2_i1.p1 TRINITY_DN1322_c0_g2~~TRINITY_DN1322_c0_g2_i1.p1  ORF type:complete len:250 (-),score=41.07 TRINITY_DN1322_c0_g2_i1:421-1170(-)
MSEFRPKRQSPRIWTSEEDSRLTAAVRFHGSRNWKLVAQDMGGKRTADQCCQRWIRVLSPDITRAEWTPEEDYRLVSRIAQCGDQSWKLIAFGMPGRTDIQCRYRWYHGLRQKYGKHPDLMNPVLMRQQILSTISAPSAVALSATGVSSAEPSPKSESQFADFPMQQQDSVVDDVHDARQVHDARDVHDVRQVHDGGNVNGGSSRGSSAIDLLATVSFMSGNKWAPPREPSGESCSSSLHRVSINALLN